MLFNYLIIHIRSMIKRPLLTVTNILGLTLGLAACILSFLHIQYELGFDKDIADHNKKYRLVTGNVANGEGWVKVSTPIAPYLKDNIPEIQEYARLTLATRNPKITVQVDDQVFNEPHFYLADASIINLFSLSFIAGDPSSALDDPSSVIISADIATKLFNESNPIGQLINVGGTNSFRVSGIYQPINPRSHVNIDYITSFENLEKMLPGTSLTGNWGQYNYYTYIELTASGSTIKQVAESKIATTKIEINSGNQHSLESLNLQPITDIHFTANRGNAKASYDPKYLIIYAAVALAILLISVINFINLTIAGSTKRIREVGVRKVVGASRLQLIMQYISESMITAGFSLIAAVLISRELLIPATNKILGSHLALSLTNPATIAIMLILIVFISLSAGFYIAVFVTGFQPDKALRGNLKMSKTSGNFKNVLLGSQFTISLILILSSIFIYRQLEYLQVKDLGLNPNQVLDISLYNQETKEKANLLKERFGQFSWVESSSTSRFTPGKANYHQTTWWEGQQTEASMSLILADENFIKTLDLKLIEGDIESILAKSEQAGFKYIINRSARDYIGWETALGKPLASFGDNSVSPILGVVEDFNYQSLHNAIDPVIIVINNEITPGQLMVKLSTTDYAMALSEMETVFKEIAPKSPFDYSFLDERFEELYQAERRTKTIVGSITILAIVLALLGLYGLVSFAVKEKTKEIAVRKVLGIRFTNILNLLSSGYFKLLLVANIIAIPIVWYVMDIWLSNFNYRIALAPEWFITGSLIVWIFVFGTISINIYHVNKIDPVDGLRYE